VEYDGRKMSIVGICPVTAFNIELCDAASGEVLPVHLRSTDEVGWVDAVVGASVVENNVDLKSSARKRKR
jgi:hypothetical protein